jgi:threonylcarbamoyladenosine tRNA methylthiotransferase MtaB
MFAVAFETLGCKLNQCETSAIAAAFANAGFPVAAGPGEAALLIVNTCAVTSKAEQKGRRVIRAALARNPLCCVLVTGCYAETDRAGLEALDEGLDGAGERRIFVVHGSQKSRIMDIPDMIVREGPYDQASLRDALRNFCGTADNAPPANPFRFENAPPKSRSRYFLKIQDGCGNSCAYCFVRIARGAERSLPASEALLRLQAAEAAGVTEAVLTGVNISRWNGAPIDGKTGLPALLDTLLSGTKSIGIRLSSLEPDVFTEDFFDSLGNSRIRPHFHLSIQSGSREILKKMGRRGEPEALLRAIDRLRSIKDDPFIACDMITGFPSETECNFFETMEFCRSANFAQIHVFPFSRRPGTAAWNYKPRVPERETGERARILQNFAKVCRKRYIELWIGRETGGICLSDDTLAAKTGVIDVLSDNYLRLRAAFSPKSEFYARKGRRLRCKIRMPPCENLSHGGGKARVDAWCDISGE